MKLHVVFVMLEKLYLPVGLKGKSAPLAHLKNVDCSKKKKKKVTKFRKNGEI